MLEDVTSADVSKVRLLADMHNNLTLCAKYESRPVRNYEVRFVVRKP